MYSTETKYLWIWFGSSALIVFLKFWSFHKTLRIHSFQKCNRLSSTECIVTINDNTIKYETSVQDALQLVKLFTKKTPTTMDITWSEKIHYVKYISYIAHKSRYLNVKFTYIYIYIAQILKIISTLMRHNSIALCILKCYCSSSSLKLLFLLLKTSTFSNFIFCQQTLSLASETKVFMDVLFLGKLKLFFAKQLC